MTNPPASHVHLSSLALILTPKLKILKKMTRSTPSSPALITPSTKPKLLLLLVCFTYLIQSINCESGIDIEGRKLRKAKKSLDLEVDSDSKSSESSHDEEDDNSEYYLEEDSDIKITKMIPSSKPTPSTIITNPFSSVVESKSIGNRIDNDQGVDIHVRFKKPNRLLVDQHRSNSNKLHFDSRTKSKDDSGGYKGGLDIKTMKSIADDVAEAILKEADRMYASMHPEDTKSSNSRVKLTTSLNAKDEKETSLSGNNILGFLTGGGVAYAKTGSQGEDYVICSKE